ncbi:MAG: beta-3-deoxy-D-manno-oct-2-ulosonic acid transferase [Burkholderiales bacterium]|jgi:capsular polysaccharide export protein
MTAYNYKLTLRKRKYLAQFIQKPTRRLTRYSCPGPNDVIYLWGDTTLPQALQGEAKVVRVEDGFLRSVGLGAAFAAPMSWSFDTQGLHHWGHTPTDLEGLIQSMGRDEPVLERAADLRRRIVASGITKYNIDHGDKPSLPDRTPGQLRVLVIGQVGGDAALRGIRTPVRTNMALLQSVRTVRPDAEIHYRPHPDVVSRIRAGQDEEWRRFADHRIETGALTELLPLFDEVHVLNSLAGFEALIRGGHVVCHAQPFYAGWGLTSDMYPVTRRSHRSLDQLVAAALIHYPRYRNPHTGTPIEPEQALDLIQELRRAQACEAPMAPWRQQLLLQFARLANWLGMRRISNQSGLNAGEGGHA